MNNRSGSFESGGGMHKKVICCIAIIILVIIALGAVGCFVAQKMYFSSEGSINNGEFQALFLTNGQVYFGKLSQVDGQYVKLNNIYYLQVQQQVQPNNNKDSNQQPQVSLTKLGNELHGPEDSMYVARSQVLFWENLKNDGKVAQAISSYQQKK